MPTVTIRSSARYEATFTLSRIDRHRALLNDDADRDDPDVVDGGEDATVQLDRRVGDWHAPGAPEVAGDSVGIGGEGFGSRPVVWQM